MDLIRPSIRFHEIFLWSFRLTLTFKLHTRVMYVMHPFNVLHIYAKLFQNPSIDDKVMERSNVVNGRTEVYGRWKNMYVGHRNLYWMWLVLLVCFSYCKEGHGLQYDIKVLKMYNGKAYSLIRRFSGVSLSQYVIFTSYKLHILNTIKIPSDRYLT